MQLNNNDKTYKVDDQGFLADPQTWDEDAARALAEHMDIELFVDHWELIWYFREYYEESHVHPTMRQMVLDLGRQHGDRFHDRKAYEQHIYGLFPTDPIHALCQLAGLPRPEPDT